jgi:molybdopterin-guanine dinucleotide biosynthesis protein MobB
LRPGDKTVSAASAARRLDYIGKHRSPLVILGVVGLQNSGKTSLLEVVIPRVSKAGFKVATVKHIAHDDLHIDVAGTDTSRHKKAGARLSVAVSDSESVYFHPRHHRLEEVLERIEHIEAPDLILVEGFKGSDLPKIVIGEADHGGSALYRWDGTPAGANEIADKIVEALVEESFGRVIDARPAAGPTSPQGAATHDSIRSLEAAERAIAERERALAQRIEEFERVAEPKKPRRFFKKG